MKDTVKVIRSLLSEEILNSLLRVRPITKATLGAVRFHLKHLSRAMSRYSFMIPLFFLEVKQGRKLFPTELEKAEHLPLKRIDDVFFFVKHEKEDGECKLFTTYNNLILTSKILNSILALGHVSPK